MTIKVAIDMGDEFAVKADYATVFDTLSDVPKSVSFFPKSISWWILGGQHLGVKQK